MGNGLAVGVVDGLAVGAGVDVAMGEGLAMGGGVATGGVGPRTPSFESFPHAAIRPALRTTMARRDIVVRGDAFRPIRRIARDYQRPSRDVDPVRGS